MSESKISAGLSSINIRKIVLHTEDTMLEGGRPLVLPARKVVACAVFRNPWAGQGFVDDLWDEMNRVGRILSLELGTRILDLIGGKDALQGFGKCAIVGIAGEMEHGAGIIHCPDFGPRFRTMVDGTTGISSTEKRSVAGVSMSIPTNHKTNRAARAYYQSVDFTLDDAPYPDEIAIAIAAVSGPRPHERIGDLTTDPQKV